MYCNVAIYSGSNSHVLGQVPCLGSPLACSYSPSGWRLPSWAYVRSAICYYMVRVRPDPWILHCDLTKPPGYLYVFQHWKYWVGTSKQPKIVLEQGQRESSVFEKYNCDIKESTMQNEKPTKPNVYATQMPLRYQHRDKRLVTFKFSWHTADDPVASEVPARKLKIDSHGVWCWQSDGCWLTGLY